MELLKCLICGGKIEIQEGGLGECTACGAGYSLESMKEIVSGTKVSITGTSEDVMQWKSLMKTYMESFDYDAATDIVKKILGASPTDEYTNEIYKQLQDLKFLDIRNGILHRYTGSASEIVIPIGVIRIEGYQMTPNWRTGAFYGCKSIKSIKLPETLIEIGKEAFSGCENLQKINIPESVTTISKLAFTGCSSLRQIKLPSKLIEISEGAFYESGLSEIILPEQLKRIAGSAFAKCENLKKVDMELLNV